MGLRNGRAPSLVLLAEVIFSLRLRSAGASFFEYHFSVRQPDTPDSVGVCP